ncbi:hypothetical protein H5410_015151 [Solanum commersonii]|uniref:Uncharacterized protein n=1 Tax=Solanum commersonii TaxID=4109 RepID=A0A9J5ZTM0_SOLCO|nr:hypothetical protein H5410_015151 [Solanum commersonii]
MPGIPNEIDPVAFYMSSDSPSPSKMLTTPLVSITETSYPTLMSPIEFNNSAPSCQPGPHLSILSDCLFEGELSESKHSESNILTASENMVIESLTQMREGLRNEGESKGKEPPKKKEKEKSKGRIEAS